MTHQQNHDMHEVIRSSASRWDDFYNLVDRFIKQGYSKVDENTEDEEGLNSELISTTTVAELKPPNIDLPLIQLEGKEIFGRYNYDKGCFEKWEISRFDLKALRKGARSENFKDRWEPFDLA